MAKVSTNISIDADLKKASQELYSDLGMDLSTAVTIFLKQSLRVQGLPFAVTRENLNVELRCASFVFLRSAIALTYLRSVVISSSSVAEARQGRLPLLCSTVFFGLIPHIVEYDKHSHRQHFLGKVRNIKNNILIAKIDVRLTIE